MTKGQQEYLGLICSIYIIFATKNAGDVRRKIRVIQNCCSHHDGETWDVDCEQRWFFFSRLLFSATTIFGLPLVCISSSSAGTRSVYVVCMLYASVKAVSSHPHTTSRALGFGLLTVIHVQIQWGNQFINDIGNTCLASVDGTNCPIQNIFLSSCKPDKRYYFYKHKWARLRYEVAISIRSNHIV